MIKIGKTWVGGFEGAIREDTYEALRNLFCDIGVIKCGGIRKPLCYSAMISENNKNVKLGEFNTDKEAHEAIIKHQVERFINNASQFTDTMQIYPCVDKGYFVTPTGLVITRFGTRVTGGLSTTGYLRTNIWVNGTHKFRSFHRMIAESLIPNPNNFPCINHKNGNKTDNRVENLEWCDYSYNTNHAYQTGLEKLVVGESHHAHKLTDKAVRDIRTNYVKGSRKRGAGFFAKKYGVDVSVIRDVANYKTWRHVI